MQQQERTEGCWSGRIGGQRWRRGDEKDARWREFFREKGVKGEKSRTGGPALWRQR